MTMVLSTECLLLPIQKRYQTQRIVKQSEKKKFIRLYLGIWKHAKLRKRAPYESKTSQHKWLKLPPPRTCSPIRNIPHVYLIILLYTILPIFFRLPPSSSLRPTSSPHSTFPRVPYVRHILFIVIGIYWSSATSQPWSTAQFWSGCVDASHHTVHSIASCMYI